ncbi:MAG: hypothetical protein LBN01_03760 [Endomicrobium sp.]|nr:hypothetical protein [Endomicrobium sp.]
MKKGLCISLALLTLAGCGNNPVVNKNLRRERAISEQETGFHEQLIPQAPTPARHRKATIVAIWAVFLSLGIITIWKCRCRHIKKAKVPDMSKENSVPYQLLHIKKSPNAGYVSRGNTKNGNRKAKGRWLLAEFKSCCKLFGSCRYIQRHC